MNKKFIHYLFLCILLFFTVVGGPIASVNKKTSKEKEFFKLGLKTFNEKKYNQSFYYWKYLVSQKPNNPVYVFNLGNIFFVQKKYEKAIIQYKKVIEKGSDLQQAAAVYMAKSLYKNGSVSKSKSLYRRVLKTPKLSTTLKEVILDDLKKIEEELKAKKKEEENDVPIEFPIGLKFFKQQKYKLALINLELASQTYKTPELYLIKGISFVKLKKYDFAKSDLKWAAKNANDPDIIHNANLLLRLIENKRKKESVDTPSDWILYFDTSLSSSTNPLTFNDLQSDTKSTQLSLFTEFGRKIARASNYALDLAYQGTYDHSLESSSGELLEHTLTARQNIVWKRFRNSITPSYTKQDLEDEPYLTKYGSRASFSYAFSNTFSSGIEYSYFSSEGANSELDYLNGDTTSYKLFINANSDKFSMSLNLFSGEDSYNDNDINVLSNESFGSSLSLFFYPTTKITISSTLSYLNKKYIPNPDDGFIKRSKNTSLSMGLSYEWSKKITYYINSNLGFDSGNETSNGEVRGNSATDELFDFEEQISVGATFYIF